MNEPPFPDGWQTDWHLVARIEQVTAGGGIDVILAGTRLYIKNEASGLIAHSAHRTYPVMVVDDEIFVLLSDAPD
jgi:hypothetical protein